MAISLFYSPCFDLYTGRGHRCQITPLSVVVPSFHADYFLCFQTGGIYAKSHLYILCCFPENHALQVIALYVRSKLNDAETNIGKQGKCTQLLKSLFREYL